MRGVGTGGKHWSYGSTEGHSHSWGQAGWCGARTGKDLREVFLKEVACT